MNAAAAAAAAQLAGRKYSTSPAPAANADPPHEAPAPGEANATGPVDLQEEIRRYRERHKAG